MIHLIAALASPPQGDVALAYTARYYSADAKAKTHSQVYVSKIDGTARRALTKGNVECSAVRWVSKTALVWVQGGGETGELWYGTLDGKVRRKLGKVDYAVPSVSPNARPGGPVFGSGTEFVQVRGTSLKKIEPVDRGWVGAKTWTGPTGNLTITVRQWPFDWSYVLVSGAASKGEDFADQNYSLEQVHQDPASKQTFVVAFIGNSTNGGAYVVNEVDWAKARLIQRCAGQDVDFDWSRDLWATISTRELTPLGKGDVWVTKAAVGNRRTGKQWSLPGKLVSFTSISLRP